MATAAICHLLFAIAPKGVAIAPRGRYVSSDQYVIAEAFEFRFDERDGQFVSSYTRSSEARFVTGR